MTTRLISSRVGLLEQERGRWTLRPREPVSFEVYHAGVCLHGTKAILAVGETLVPGWESTLDASRTTHYLCSTADLDAAVWGAERAVGESCGRHLPRRAGGRV